METTPVLSIIMPCYNVADTLTRALDSILMQQTRFPYEILIVDDCSTDNTVGIVRSYKEKHEQIKLIQHETNLGNAHAFYDGLRAAQGDNFCVLDGDDYYTHTEKLQRQIDFFNGDVLCDYVASVHHFVYDLGNGNISIDKRQPVSEFTYVDYITQSAGYYHTSTYMFRNIFRGNVPEYFKEKEFRGDSPRTFFHLQASRKKVKVLDFVGSAYYYSQVGIWSGMNLSQQREYQIWMQKNLCNMTDTNYEKEIFSKRIKSTESWASGDSYRSYSAVTIDSCLEQLNRYTHILAFGQKDTSYIEKDFMLEGLYYSQYIDSLCATLGFINRIYHPECMQLKADDNKIAIVVGILSPQGGGIYREIVELIEIYDDKEVLILVTNMTDDSLPDAVRELSTAYSNIEITASPVKGVGKLVWLGQKLADFSPAKAYFYASHDDPYSQALLQSGVCKNVSLFSFDHGFICGITNPDLDVVIAKRPLDYLMLSKRLGEKVVYIPTWDIGTRGCEGLRYQPFNGHDNLITASGAARFYKLSGKPPYSYLDNVLELLERTKGKHYHFGPIPIDKLDYIYSYLRKHDLPKSAFEHIEWSDNLARDMLTNGVDVFIEPFPIVSYKMTLDVLAAGIPVIAHESARRMSRLDFIYQGNLLWKSNEDFVNTLSTITARQLEEHSRLSLEYYSSTHAIDIIKPYLTREIAFPCPQTIDAVDDGLQEIRQYEKIFGKNGELIISGQKPASKKPEGAAQTEGKKQAASYQNDANLRMLESITNSRSYKIGRAITAPPRIVLKVARSLRYKGLRETLSAVKRKISKRH